MSRLSGSSALNSLRGAYTDSDEEVEFEEEEKEEVAVETLPVLPAVPDPDAIHEEEGQKIHLPPEPEGQPNLELQERFSRLHSMKAQQGLDMNFYIQRNKEFKNPSIYEKLIQHCNINELGTNYPPDIYNPPEWKESSFYDELAKIQRADLERREKEKKQRTKVEVISATTVKKTNTTNPASIPPPITHL